MTTPEQGAQEPADEPRTSVVWPGEQQPSTEALPPDEPYTTVMRDEPRTTAIGPGKPDEIPTTKVSDEVVDEADGKHRKADATMTVQVNPNLTQPVPDPPADVTQAVPTTAISPPPQPAQQQPPPVQQQAWPPADFTQPVPPSAMVDFSQTPPPGIPFGPGTEDSGEIQLQWDTPQQGQFTEEKPKEDKEKGKGGSIAALVVAILIVVAVIGSIVYFSRNRPVGDNTQPTGSATPTEQTGGTTGEPTGSESPNSPLPTTAGTPAGSPLQQLAAHPLSATSAVMNPLTCQLTRFNPNDQALFFNQGKTCADSAWNSLLPGAGMPAVSSQVTTVQSGPVPACGGQLAPTDKPKQCETSIFMTGPYLRDVEHNGLYPGRYLGVFLREYAHLVQETSGLKAIYLQARGAGDQADLDRRYEQQAACLVGVAIGAMRNQGDVDNNIFNEVLDRVSTVDAPPDARIWLEKGAQTRQLSSCNSWGVA